MNSVSWNCLCLCVCLMGVAWALPSQISSAERNIEVELPDEVFFDATSESSTSERASERSSTTQGAIVPPVIITSADATSTAISQEESTTKGTTKIANSEENLQTSTAKPTATSEGEDSTTKSTTELSEEAIDRVQCLADWDKFLSDFGNRYTSEIETEKRRNVFCDNWQSIKKHNKQFELGLVSYDLGINQFSDLTFEEWRMKQQPHRTLMDQEIQ